VLILVLATRFGPLSVEQKNKLFGLEKQVLPPLLEKSVSVESVQDFFRDI
jgi:hypothetical protein